MQSIWDLYDKFDIKRIISNGTVLMFQINIYIRMQINLYKFQWKFPIISFLSYKINYLSMTNTQLKSKIKFLTKFKFFLDNYLYYLKNQTILCNYNKNTKISVNKIYNYSVENIFKWNKIICIKN